MKKEMLINVLQPEECRIAIIEDGVLEELYVERNSHESYTGNIYKGRIVNLEPAIQAAFVDFSVGRNGFLHVSDVEPRYYRRHLTDDSELSPRDRGRDPRLDRDRGRDRGRSPRSSHNPPSGEDRPAREPREPRERPDRSERGRRDRSEPPRRFGEGLVEDERPAYVPPAARENPPIEPTPAEPIVEPIPIPPRTESPSFREIIDSPIPTARDREPIADDRGGSFGRGPLIDDPEADLPPSRTHRGRSSPRSFPTQTEFGASLDDSTADPAPLGDDPGLSPSLEPRRGGPAGRGRGRGSRGRSSRDRDQERRRERDRIRELEQELEIEREIEPEASAKSEPFEPPFDEPPRPRGRDAIRARGYEGDPADRPRRPERPIPPPAAPLPPPGADRPRDDRFESFPPDRDRGRIGFEPDRPAPAAPRGRMPEPFDPPRGRVPGAQPHSPHARAGEPGYVPRRERGRTNDPIEPAETARFPWDDPEPIGFETRDRDAVPPFEPAEPEDDAAAEGAQGDIRRRRRRRRRRGEDRDRDRPSRPVGEPKSEPLPGLSPSFEPDEPDELDLEIDVDRIADEPDELDLDDDEPTRGRSPAASDEEIEPELTEEIRREVEEIAELERELGMRPSYDAPPGRAGDDLDVEPAEPVSRTGRGRGFAKPPLQEIFRRGDEVLIQVIKESIGTKGPTLSTYISIPGRYLVLMPGLNRVGVSRKIADEGQRRKLREIMNELNPPKGLGFIVRTAGLDRTKRELARDLAYLLRLWKVILRRIKKAKAPAPIYQESDMITRTIRDIFTTDIDTIWIDEPQAFERAQEFLRVVMPKFVNRLKFYDEKVPLFHKYGLEEEIAKIQRRRIDLPEGGSIVIDQTEALVAIDVNSGNFRVENDAERTAYEMNLRAAKEIARQLRLRDLGGVIVNDFIDMRDERHRRGVERALREAVKRDRARTKILRISQFGMIEMTRQRIRPSLKRSVYEDCSHCAGAGVVKTAESMSIDVMRMLALAAHREEIQRINICVSAPVANHLNNRKRREIGRIEDESNMTIHIRHEEGVPAEHLQFDCFDAAGNEVRLLPSPPPPPRRGR